MKQQQQQKETKWHVLVSNELWKKCLLNKKLISQIMYSNTNIFTNIEY